MSFNIIKNLEKIDIIFCEMHGGSLQKEKNSKNNMIFGKIELNLLKIKKFFTW